MEKYIIILVLLASIYYIQNKLKDTEGFEAVPTQSLGGVDDTNAINTLAQISKQLMVGGITVPGNMRVQGDLSTGEGKISINNGTINLTSDGGGGLYFLKSGSVQKDQVYNRLYTGDLTVNGNQSVSGGLGVGALISSKGNLNARTDGFNTRVGGIWTAPGVYAEGDKNLEIGAGSGNIYVGAANMGARQNLWVTGAHRVGGVGMRIFTMQVGDNAETPVKDPEGNQYKWGEWVCCVQGLRMDWGGGPGAINQFCHQRDGFWWIRSESEGSGDSGWPVILAIPWGFFDKVWEPPNGPGFLGGW